ncbi:MAG: beta-lactamase family protein [Candidatus Dormibacteraeota bacterium]|nr:beta-lactamase family protein [Candidatus Dormibacteraeota bacterium]
MRPSGRWSEGVAPDIDAAALDSQVDEILNRHPAVGLGIAVVRKGRLAQFRGRGFADLRSKAPITEDTAFRIGSITKTFTAIAVMQLWERGEVDLDAPAAEYLRAFRLVPARASFRPVTVRHLLTHTAGIPEIVHPSLGFYLLGEFVKAERPVPALSDYYRGGLPVRTDPGTRFRYTDHGFSTLGQIVEDVSGKPLDRFLRESVFDPLGMTDTGLVRSERNRSRLATGYRLGSRGVKPVADYEVVTAAAGGAYSTLRDMARYAAALLAGGSGEGGRVLRPETLELMYGPHYQPDPRIPGDGLVFSRGVIGGRPVVWHGGILPDFISQMWLAPDAGLGLVAFTNGSRSAHLWLPSEASRLLGGLLGGPADAIRTDVPQHPEVWPEICGYYHLPAALTDVRARIMLGIGGEVFVRKGRLMARVLTPIPACYRGFELHPDDENDPYVFRVDLSQLGLPTSRVVFSGDSGGPVSRAHFELHPLSLEKEPRIRDPRLWAKGALAGLALGASAAVMGRRRREERGSGPRPPRCGG